MFKRIIVLTAAIVLVMTLVSAMGLAFVLTPGPTPPLTPTPPITPPPTPTPPTQFSPPLTPPPPPPPTPTPTMWWDYWLTVSSSNAAQGLVREKDGNATDSIKFWFHNDNPWPEGGLTIEALPNKGFQFDGWYKPWYMNEIKNEELVTTENPYTFIGMHTTLIAKFSAVEATKVNGIKTLRVVYVVKGTTIKLPGAVQPYNAADKSMNWISANKRIATVDKDGNVTGVNTGITAIYVTSQDGKKTAMCVVYVVKKAVALKSLLMFKDVTLTAGKTMQVNPVLIPVYATGIVPRFETSNAEIAFIDAVGVISALRPGKTTITVTADKLTREFVLTVEEAVKK